MWRYGRAIHGADISVGGMAKRSRALRAFPPRAFTQREYAAS